MKLEDTLHFLIVVVLCGIILALALGGDATHTTDKNTINRLRQDSTIMANQLAVRDSAVEIFHEALHICESKIK